MRVYKWWFLDDRQWLEIESAETPRLREFNGTPLLAGWSPIHVGVVKRSERGRALGPTDFPSLHCFGEAVSGDAAARLGAYLARFGEFLPLACPDGEYFAYNVTNVVDGLDLAASEVEYYPDGRVAGLNRLVFDYARIRDAGVFKLPQTRVGVYLTDAAREEILSAGLDGFTAAEGGSGFVQAMEVQGEPDS